MRVSAAMSPEARAAALRTMGQAEVDVLVVGGVVGAGAALDAATRGLTTAIVEARDWASGTSSRSSKLIHGGLRYLQMLDFGLVREALHERGLVLDRLAPHLVRPVPFLYPLKHRIWERPYVGSGILLYDVMSAVGRHGARGCAPSTPDAPQGAARGALPQAVGAQRRGAVLGAQIDDARYTLTVVRTAVHYGALAANRAEVTAFLREGERVTGAEVHDREAGTGIILRTERSVLFVIPWGRHWIIGTTDTDWQLEKAHPAASARDIDYLLDHVNSVLVSPLTRADVEGLYAGLRPLLSGESESTSTLSREHVVGHPVPGLVVVAGGKYTTYRVMAKDAVNEAVRGLDRRVTDSVTDRIPLAGADGYEALKNQRHALAASSGLHVERIDHLLSRYGTMLVELLDLLRADASLAEPLLGADDYLRVEVLYAVTHESARRVDDVPTRRTRASIEAWDRGVRAAPVVAALMAGPLDWDEKQVAAETEYYHKRVQAERDSQDQPDDATAAAARLNAPDITTR
jgi:glycerol-3-phosphate dehydrogenase